MFSTSIIRRPLSGHFQFKPILSAMYKPCVKYVLCEVFTIKSRTEGFYCLSAFVLDTESIQLCAFDVGETTKACLPLLVSMVSFEATHGDSQRAICEIELLVQKYPNNVELWLLCAR